MNATEHPLRRSPARPRSAAHRAALVRRSRLLGGLAVCAALAACVPEHGTNGPALAEPASGEGPCFEVTLMNGLNDAREVELLFDCFNAHGAFAPLEPTVRHAVDQPAFTDLVAAMGSGDDGALPDTQELLEGGAALLSDEADPVSGALDIYVELYDDYALLNLLALTERGAGAMLACEESGDPAACSALRLAARVLESDYVDRIEGVADALAESRDEASARITLEANIRMAERMSSFDGGDNVIVAAGVLLMRPSSDGRSALEKVQPFLAELLREDADADGVPDLVPAIIPYVVESWESGDLDRLADQLYEVQTTSVSGQEVGFEGVSMLDQLLVNAAALGGEADATMLFEDMQIGSATITPYEAGLNFVEKFYNQLQDSAQTRDNVRVAMSNDMGSIIDDICTSVGNRSDFCRTLDAVGVSLDAVIGTELPITLLPITYGITQAIDLNELVLNAHGKELDELTADELDAVLAWAEELGADLEPFSAITLEERSLNSAIELLPALVDPDAEELTVGGAHAAALARWAVSPWSDDGGPELVPLLVPQSLLVTLLEDASFTDALDFMMGDLAPRLLDPESALHLDKIEAMQASFDEHLPEIELDMVAEARDLLANEDLWMAGLRLGADAELIELLRPETGTGVTWYLYDLIDRGVVDRMLGFVAGVLDTLLEDDATE